MANHHIFSLHGLMHFMALLGFATKTAQGLQEIYQLRGSDVTNILNSGMAAVISNVSGNTDNTDNAATDVSAVINDAPDDAPDVRDDTTNDTPDDAPDGPQDPNLTDCLLSAVSKTDCGSILPGCVWCKEPIAGLCVTATAASRIRWMPFFSCSSSDPSEETTAVGEKDTFDTMENIAMEEWNDAFFEGVEDQEIFQPIGMESSDETAEIF